MLRQLRTGNEPHVSDLSDARSDDPDTEFRPVGPATPLVEATAGAAAAVFTGIGSALRRARLFHPDGVAFQATVDLEGGEHGAPLLDEPARRRAIVRLSRGTGVPEPLPDVLGMAVRFLDVHGPEAHQDLLLVTSGGPPLLRHTFAPVRSFDHERWSSVLPYRVGGQLVLLGARPLRSEGPPVQRLADLAEEVASGRLRFALEMAPVTGSWEILGTIELGARLTDAEAESLRFSAANAGGGVEPAGVLQATRRLAYRASQAARPRLLDGDG
jgi:hypothetical protein